MGTSERRRRARWGAALALGIAGLLGSGAGAQDSAAAEARATVEATVDRVLSILQDGDLSDATKRSRIQEVAYARFDFDTIAKLVLARSWRRFSPEQRERFIEEFKEHLALTYGDNLSEYRNESVEIEDTRIEPNRDVTVRTRVVGRPEPIVIDYRLRKSEGEWRVIDVIVEGVSMISNFRSQTQEIVRERGPEGLIETLREKNAARADAA